MLEIKKLNKSFGGLVATEDFDMTIGGGEFVGLIGPNGAGKKTIFNQITGYLKPTRGRIFFEDKDITGLSPHNIAARGIIRTFQISALFTEYTVLQNVVAACNLKPKISFWEAAFHTASNRKKEQEILSRSRELVHFVGLDSLIDSPSSALPHGHKRVLSIAIALAANPKLLLLDEPFSGMNSEEVAHAMGVITRISEKGTSILLIEHNMKAAMKLCKRLVVINFGKKIAEGTPGEIKADPEVIHAYLGASKNAA
jgi:branched-chain amino acid transport system ATP-binding protein